MKKQTLEMSKVELRIGETLAANPDFSTGDIALVCELTERQVKRHLQSIYKKLGISGFGARRMAGDWFKEAQAWPTTERQTRIESGAGLTLLLDRQIAAAERDFEERWMAARRTTTHIGRIGGDEADPYWFALEAAHYSAAEDLRVHLAELRRLKGVVSKQIEDMLNEAMTDDEIKDRAVEWLKSIAN